MISYCQALLKSTSPIKLFIVVTEQISLGKALEFVNKSIKEKSNVQSEIIQISRPRYVNQSWFTTPFTCLKSFIECFVTCYLYKPNLVVTCGPGIAVPFVFSSKLLRIGVVFIESFC